VFLTEGKQPSSVKLLGMKKLRVGFCFLLLASACGGASDSDELEALRAENEILKSQTTTTVVPITTVAPTTTVTPTTLAPAVISACRAQMKMVYKEQTDWDSEGDEEFISSLNKCVRVET